MRIGGTWVHETTEQICGSVGQDFNVQRVDQGRLVDNAELRLQFGTRAVETVRRAFDAERNVMRLLALCKRTADEAKSASSHHLRHAEKQIVERF